MGKLKMHTPDLLHWISEDLSVQRHGFRLVLQLTVIINSPFFAANTAAYTVVRRRK